LDEARNKVLVLSGSNGSPNPAVDGLRSRCEVVEVPTVDQAIELLRRDHFSAVFSDSAGFLPLERALVGQQANLILNTIGEGVCIVDGEGRCSWMNKKMGAWPPRVHDKIRATCREAFELFSKQVSPQSADAPLGFSRSKRYSLTIAEDQQFMELIASPVIDPATGHVAQVAAVVWDATGTRRLQQKIDAIDKAGSELVHFDHFAIRLLDRKSNKLELCISAGIPSDALNLELFAEAERNGISGYVGATGRSYICPDVERDPRYVMGLDSAKSSLTVPLRLHDKVIGVFNIESRQRAAFNEDDRQFAEIFGRYVAIALNILDLMVVERVNVSHKVADDVCSEVAGPLNDIAMDVTTLMDDYIGHDDLRARMQAVLDNVGFIRKSLSQAAEGPNTKVLGAGNVKAQHDAVIGLSHVLVADDEPNIRNTIHDVLRKYGAVVTTAVNGAEAIALIERNTYDLVVSDIKMPDKTGYDVFAAAHKTTATLPVILMTGFGYDPNHSIVRASQEGLAAVLFKPFKVEQLLSEVRKALAGRAVAAGQG
jgi:CheY-like chemotaxis protein